MPMGQAAVPVLEATGFRCLRAEQPGDVLDCARAGLTMAYKSNASVAVLLTQRLIGAKAF
jgi:sulfopyruvate decarboxylase TPP-binding subunit